MLNIIEKDKCCGCSACFSICPKKCISMVRDEEGFLYPKIDNISCINCNLCRKVCPVINNDIEIKKEQAGYLVRHKNLDVVSESTSGGAFTAFAEKIIMQHGVVCGAALENNYVRHIIVSNISELYKFRNSKYVQSDITGIYPQIKKYLLDGASVLFSGTACQIEGLLKYLGQAYPNLYTIDVVCRAVPSPLVFEKYMQYQSNKYGNDLTIKFRDKSFYGYSYSNLSIKNKEKIIYHGGVERDEYLRLFFEGLCNRPSCSKCVFKKRYRISDITIWDCFDLPRFNSFFKKDIGVTKVLLHSEQGKKLFNSLNNIDYFYVSPDKLTENAREMFESTPNHPKRKYFMNDLNVLSLHDLFDKYCKYTIKNKSIALLKRMLIRTKIYSLLKTKKMKKIKQIKK